MSSKVNQCKPLTAGHRSAAGGEGEADAAADMFPLVLSPREQQLVTKCLREDLLVLGRGGTGKTTVTVHAMAAAAAEDADARVLFLTVNSHLCTSVWRQVTSLRRGTELAKGPVAAAALAAIRAAALPAAGGGGGTASGGDAEDSAGPPAPAAVCDAAGAAWWPLCMPSRAWLLALDAALLRPFLCREAPSPAAAAAGASPRIADADAAFAAAILGTGGAPALAGGVKAGGGGAPPGGARVFAGFDFWKVVYDKHAVGHSPPLPLHRLPPPSHSVPIHTRRLQNLHAG